MKVVSSESPELVRTVLSCVCAYLVNDLSDWWLDKKVNACAYLIARSMHDCLSRSRVVAPMAPQITQTTSYQRDALYWRGAEILAPHRQPWTGQAFKTTLPVPFPLADGVICGWAEQVFTVPVAGYQRPWLWQTLKLNCIYLPPLVLSVLFIFFPKPECGQSSTEHWEAQFGELKLIPFIGSWYDSQLIFHRICAGIVHWPLSRRPRCALLWWEAALLSQQRSVSHGFWTAGKPTRGAFT